MTDILNNSSHTVLTVVSHQQDCGSSHQPAEADHQKCIDDRVNIKIAEGVKKAVHLIT